jgi:DNA-binding protein Fis
LAIKPRKNVPLRLRDVERIVIQRMMEQTGHNQSAAARLLGISRPTLIRKLKTYRIGGETRRPDAPG